MIKHGIIKQEKFLHSVRELLVIPHRDKNLTVSFPAFGFGTYNINLREMEKDYSHPVTGKKVSFRPATISESISAVSYNFGSKGHVDFKRDIFDSGWLQAGYIVRTQEGIFTNTNEINEANLKHLLNKAEKVNGIYLLNNGIGFAPYDSFDTSGVQDIETFAQGGLARVLEHTSEKIAMKLKEIGSSKDYKEGLNVHGFCESQNPILNVINFNSEDFTKKHDHFLNIYGDWSIKNHTYGSAFGVLKEN